MTTKNHILTFLKLLLLVSSGILIAFGWIQGIDIYAIFGAILFLITLCINVFSLIKTSVRYRNGHIIEDNIDKKLISKFVSTIEGLFILSGLITMLSDDPLFKTPGMIIWIGTLFIYVLSGIIVWSITDLPLKMGYGGWYISHRQR
jgi:hypothetical protein